MGFGYWSGGFLRFMVVTDVIRSKKVKRKRNPENPFVIFNEEAFFLELCNFCEERASF